MKEAGEKGDQRGQALALFSSSIVDEQGAALFDEEEATQFIRSISIDTMNAIMTAITELSGKGKVKATENGAAGAEVPAANPSSAARSESSPTA
jgi:hypothetical protein